MIILPAIDLKGGRCVRLKQGRADDETVYGEDPVEMAKHWLDQGARYLHVVDLDGAFSGAPVHHEVIRAICAALPIPVQTGGGLRTDDDINLLLDCGVDRVILGTRAWAEPETLQRLIDQYGKHIAVGIDARDGQVQIKGWTETTSQTAIELAQQADTMGLQTLIFTDTSTDGMMRGTNVPAMDELCKAVSCHVIASGGVSNQKDVEDLRDLGHDNLIGAIVGKALYEDAVTLTEIQ